jgi:hypothetical protein
MGHLPVAKKGKHPPNSENMEPQTKTENRLTQIDMLEGTNGQTTQYYHNKNFNSINETATLFLSHAEDS